ncbi:formin-like protein 6 [Dioscorea cayenensis subsp. rotundata]|uniref:Formin-like protein n=1 Tax=Dioscorea cayennensis subsp. rotundata TaxID=55577 RepID=A0AB40AP41_DIOCR|nr:formin-like protein 6 [Dioscorea cayenensis subsp. rotundata]
MALLRKWFHRKPPDGLLDISDRVFVFDSCFSTDVSEDDEYKTYVGNIVSQLRDQFPSALFMVFNFREGVRQSWLADILSEYDVTVMDYPRHYQGCPLLTMEIIHHFLRSSENWLSLGPENILLMHCERGGWPVLAFMLAGLLIYQKQYTGERKTLDMIYKQAPRELLQLFSPLNPLASQIRYLQYISRRNFGSEWPPVERALTLDCVILRKIPNFDGKGGFRPIFRIYMQDTLTAADQTSPKQSKSVQLYKQADSEVVKIDICRHIQGDVVLECIHVDEDLQHKEMAFSFVFNTAFIRSNLLMLNCDEIDILWDSKDRFPKDFRVEVLLSEMDAVASVTAMDLRRSEEKEGLPVEVFSKVQEMFSNMDWLDANTDATKTSVDNMGMIFQEKAENHAMPREQTSLPLPLKHEGQQLPPMPPPQPPPPPSTPPPQRRQSSSTHGDCITFPLRSRTSPLPSEVTSSLPPTLQPVSIGVAPPCPPPPPPIRSQRASPKIAPSTPPPPPPPSRTSSIYSSKSNSKENKGKDNDIVLQSLNAGAVSTTKPIGVMGRGLRRSISPKNSQFTNSSSRKILKPLHWVKVSRAMKGSLWAEPHRPDEAFKSLEIDMSELENLFSAAVPSAKEKSSRRSSVGSRTEKVHLVDLRRANNCEIMRTGVKMSTTDLLNSVLALDDSILNADQIDSLTKLCPTKEEIDLLQGYTGDKQKLGKCEQFFLELMKVPRMESKLRVFSFKIQFHSQVAELRNNLNTINSTAEEIKSSIKLKRIMQTILSLGNALNQGTARGSAIGFKLDSLLKLSDIRTRNSKMTLMHYLCKVLADKLPEVLDFEKDIPSLETAVKIQLKVLAEEMQAISKGLEKVEQELTLSENDGLVSQAFHKTLKAFLVSAEAKVRTLTSLYSGVGRNADALALYFGEDPVRCPFEQVVSTLHTFVKMFGRAHEDNCKQVELDKKRAQKEAEMEKMKLSTPKKEIEHNMPISSNTRS